MCGIAGLVTLKGRTIDSSIASTMGRAIRHRGPDGDGLYTSENKCVTFAHRRLSILDLSEAARQPMQSVDRQLTIVFNGEIYNYLEIRSELKGKGFPFVSSSDTEVILHAYEAWGTSCLDRFRGMFAFALYDARREKVIVARDRLGIKPLFIYRDVQKLLFCSELDPLRDALQSRRLDRASLASFLHHRYVPEERTIWSGIDKLLPGTYLDVDLRSGTTRQESYWSLEEVACRAFERRERSIECEEIISSLRRSVHLHTRSDVPIGVLLSGGLDSSSVLCLLREANPNLSIQAFTAGFGNAKSEVRTAEAVAAAYKSDHQKIELSASSLEETLHLVAGMYGNPLADSSAVPFYHLSKEVSRHVKVALGGDGGDELFLGYLWHIAYEWMERFTRGRRRSIPQAISNRVGPDSRLATLFLALAEEGGSRLDVLHGCPFSWDDVCNLTQYSGQASDIELRSNLPRDVALRVRDLLSFTVDAVLYKVDVASMAHGLEIRVPLLDHVLLEHSMQLPIRALVQGMKGKACLRKCMKNRLPPAVLTGRKSGFGAPLREWEESIQQLAEAKLPHGRAVSSGLLDGDAVSEFVFGPSWRKQTKLWTLLVLEEWLSVRSGWE